MERKRFTPNRFGRDRDTKEYLWRTAAAAAVVLSILLVLLLIWAAAQVFLILFAGILFGVFLRSLSDWVDHHSPLGSGGSLALVVSALLGLLCLAGWYLAPDIATQIDQLIQSLPGIIRQLGARIEGYEWGRRILSQLPDAAERFARPGNILSRATGAFSTAFGLIADLVIISFVGLYLAVNPALYVNGIVRLVPVDGRPRARELLGELGETLRWWLIGRMIAMGVIGLLTAVGLWLIGVPLALTLGLLAGILNFIPYLGPILSAVPPLLMVSTGGMTKIFYVVLLYLAVQTIESYLLTPLVTEKTISLPPALTLAAQVLLGILLGPLGVIFASPITAIGMKLIEMLYVEDLLEAGSSATNAGQAANRG